MIKVAAVPDGELAHLKEENAKLVEEREHYRELYQQAIERCRKLELGILGQKSERLVGDEAQLTMAVLATIFGKPVVADRLVRDFSDGDRLTLGPASRMSNAFSSWHVQGRYGFIAACSAGSVRSSSG
jgi:hypothetical protein